MNIAYGIVLGIVVGVLSGLLGVGGGVILVPILVYALAMPQQTAQGTSLAMLLPPTGLLAFWRYYKSGHTDIKLGLLLALGLFIGGYFGGGLAQQLPAATLRRVFAVFLGAVAVKMFLQK
jgi:uncharacterized protein